MCALCIECSTYIYIHVTHIQASDYRVFWYAAPHFIGPFFRTVWPDVIICYLCESYNLKV